MLIGPDQGSFSLQLPQWLLEQRLPRQLPAPEQRMQLILDLAQQNIEQQSGGPFAAGVFERQSGKLVAVGVNRVMAHNCSSAHAEVMALSLAQKRLANYDLGASGLAAHQLVVNWRPCAMCFGALLWSGVRSLLIAGSGPELEQITGFDEGPIHPQWRAELSKRGIELIEDVLREPAIALYQQFASSAQPVYNSRRGA